MDAAARLQLIRARFSHGGDSAFKPRGMHVAANPDAITATKPKRAEPPTNQGHKISAFAGPIMPHRTNSMMDWIYAPEPKQKRDKRLVRRGAHHLNKIAEKWKTLKRYQ